MTKTAADVAMLKSQWKADGTWDIEDTEGFGEYYDELKAYREQVKREWAEKRERELLAKAEMLHVPGNKSLVLYLERLENEIKELHRRLA